VQLFEGDRLDMGVRVTEAVQWGVRYRCKNKLLSISISWGTDTIATVTVNRLRQTHVEELQALKRHKSQLSR